MGSVCICLQTITEPVRTFPVGKTSLTKIEETSIEEALYVLSLTVDLKNRDIQYAAKIPDTVMVYVSPHYKHLI